jgi:hypothetical protein
VGVFFNTSPQSSLWAGLYFVVLQFHPVKPLHELLESRSFLLDSMCRLYRLLTGEISQFSNATSALQLIHQFFPLLSIPSSTATPYILEGGSSRSHRLPYLNPFGAPTLLPLVNFNCHLIFLFGILFFSEMNRWPDLS